MEVKLFLKDFNNKELLKIKKYTNLPMSIIKSENNKPFFSFIDFEDFKKNNYDINVTNDFNFFKNLIIFLKNEDIGHYIENYNNLEDLILDYSLYNQVKNANYTLDILREKYPDSESWEEVKNDEQKIFIKINGIIYDAMEIIK